MTELDELGHVVLWQSAWDGQAWPVSGTAAACKLCFYKYVAVLTQGGIAGDARDACTSVTRNRTQSITHSMAAWTRGGGSDLALCQVCYPRRLHPSANPVYHAHMCAVLLATGVAHMTWI